jgi:hypothetical protein
VVQNDNEETEVIIQALIDTNLPKLIKDDVFMFHNLIRDLFSLTNKLKKKHDVFEKCISIATRELGLQQWPAQSEKVVFFKLDLNLIRN